MIRRRRRRRIEKMTWREQKIAHRSNPLIEFSLWSFHWIFVWGNTCMTRNKDHQWLGKRLVVYLIQTMSMLNTRWETVETGWDAGDMKWGEGKVTQDDLQRNRQTVRCYSTWSNWFFRQFFHLCKTVTCKTAGRNVQQGCSKPSSSSLDPFSHIVSSWLPEKPLVSSRVASYCLCLFSCKSIHVTCPSPHFMSPASHPVSTVSHLVFNTLIVHIHYTTSLMPSHCWSLFLDMHVFPQIKMQWKLAGNTQWVHYYCVQ